MPLMDTHRPVQVNPYEDPEAALVRELHEELSIEVRAPTDLPVLSSLCDLCKLSYFHCSLMFIPGDTNKHHSGGP